MGLMFSLMSFPKRSIVASSLCFVMRKGLFFLGPLYPSPDRKGNNCFSDYCVLVVNSCALCKKHTEIVGKRNGNCGNVLERCALLGA